MADLDLLASESGGNRNHEMAKEDKQVEHGGQGGVASEKDFGITTVQWVVGLPLSRIQRVDGMCFAGRMPNGILTILAL